VTPNPSSHKRVPLGDLLLQHGLITQAELDAALAYKHERGAKLGQALVALNLVSQSDIAQALREQGKVHCIELRSTLVDREVAERLGEERSRKLRAIAINRIAGVVTLAIEDPTDVYNVDAISAQLGEPVFAVRAEPDHISTCITEVFERPAGDVDRIDDILGRSEFAGHEVKLDLAGEDEEAEGQDLDQPVIHMVRALLEEAFAIGASDIHLEPNPKGLNVRFRVDGVLFERAALPRAWARPVLARIKILATLDIAERRLPQDGRAQAEIRGARVDLRVATTPTLHGEGAVIRLLDGGRKLLDLSTLEFGSRELADLKQMVEGGEGVVLATGPTGHGKTTTLYAILQHINAPDTKIITIEDPVENQMAGVTQINVNAKIGLSFARGLRSVLRQDPDVVLVGEIRDQETAQIGIQAALTGHLVLSTLHTVGTAESVTRLVDMGVEPYLLADTLRGIVAQRLVRRICVRCRHEVLPRAELLARLGLARSDGPFYAGAGCDHCSRTGYKGRIGLYEVMPMTPELCALVRVNAGAERLRAVAVENGMQVLRQDGLTKVRTGQTSLEEIHAATARG
jgi:type II secretory ATPase GspE/PulE/Tfp pilus assembly ATPase PilB-like protein